MWTHVKRSFSICSVFMQMHLNRVCLDADYKTNFSKNLKLLAFAQNINHSETTDPLQFGMKKKKEKKNWLEIIRKQNSCDHILFVFAGFSGVRIMQTNTKLFKSSDKIIDFKLKWNGMRCGRPLRTHTAHTHKRRRLQFCPTEWSGVNHLSYRSECIIIIISDFSASTEHHAHNKIHLPWSIESMTIRVSARLSILSWITKFISAEKPNILPMPHNGQHVCCASRGFVFVSSSFVPCLHRIGTSGTTAGMGPTAKTLIYTKDATTTCVSRYETNHPRQPASHPAGVLVLVHTVTYAGCGAAMAWRIWHIASFENDVRYIGQNLSYYKSYTYSVCVFASFNTQPYKPSSKSIKCRFVPYFRSDHGFIISHKHIHRRHFLALAVDVNAVLV